MKRGLIDLMLAYASVNKIDDSVRDLKDCYLIDVLSNVVYSVKCLDL